MGNHTSTQRPEYPTFILGIPVVGYSLRWVFPMLGIPYSYQPSMCDINMYPYFVKCSGSKEEVVTIETVYDSS